MIILPSKPGFALHKGWLAVSSTWSLCHLWHLGNSLAGDVWPCSELLPGVLTEYWRRLTEKLVLEEVCVLGHSGWRISLQHGYQCGIIFTTSGLGHLAESLLYKFRGQRNKASGKACSSGGSVLASTYIYLWAAIVNKNTSEKPRGKLNTIL